MGLLGLVLASARDGGCDTACKAAPYPPRQERAAALLTSAPGLGTAWGQVGLGAGVGGLKQGGSCGRAPNAALRPLAGTSHSTRRRRTWARCWSPSGSCSTCAWCCTPTPSTPKVRPDPLPLPKEEMGKGLALSSPCPRPSPHPGASDISVAHGSHQGLGRGLGHRPHHHLSVSPRPRLLALDLLPWKKA